MEFEVLETLGAATFAMGERTGGVEVIKQRKKKDDGHVTGPFISVKIDAGRTMFVHLDTAEKLHGALGEMIPIASAASQKLREEREKSKKVTKHTGPRSPGKTERDRAKGKTNAKRTRPLEV